MKNKILIAVDESKNAMKAVEHVGNITWDRGEDDFVPRPSEGAC